jgi:transglutaminase-like putative cysteine protease
MLPVPTGKPGAYRDTGKTLRIDPLGEKEFDLFIPPLHKPLQSKDPRVTLSRKESGGYYVKINGDVPSVEFPLENETGLIYQSHLLEVYARPVGFKKSEWPELMQANVFAKYSEEDAKNNPIQVAQAVADYIAVEHLYSVGPRPEKDPIAAMKAGAFQCDMAAYSMVAVLRDVYKIPSRVVGGYRGKNKKSSGTNNSYLVMPGEAHVWVEVFHNG